MTELASVAFRLALRGKAVSRLAPGSKEPMKGSHGHLDATTEADVVRAWWTADPDANVAVATGARSKLWVLDIDPKHGGNESLIEIINRFGELPPTVSVHTPSGGIHFWWAWPADIEIRGSQGRVGEGIDVLGEGNYVICPPSRLATGGRYRWVEPSAGVIAPAPDWLVKLTQKPPRAPAGPREPIESANLERYVAAAIVDELHRLEQAAESRRNRQLNATAFAIAGFVKAGAVPEDWAIDTLENIGINIGLEPREIQRTITSAFQAATARELPQ